MEGGRTVIADPAFEWLPDLFRVASDRNTVGALVGPATPRYEHPPSIGTAMPLPLNRRAATLVGFCAVLLWSLLALFTAASGTMPPFQLTAISFGIGGLAGVALWAARPRAIKALRQPCSASAASSATTSSTSPRCATHRRSRPG
jgi:hypothetical protein